MMRIWLTVLFSIFLTSQAFSQSPTAEETIQWISEKLNEVTLETVDEDRDRRIFTYTTKVTGDYIFIIRKYQLFYANKQSGNNGRGDDTWWYNLYNWRSFYESEKSCPNSYRNICKVILKSKSYSSKLLGYSEKEGFIQREGWGDDPVPFQEIIPPKSEMDERRDLEVEFSPGDPLIDRFEKAFKHLIEVTGNKQPF